MRKFAFIGLVATLLLTGCETSKEPRMPPPPPQKGKIIGFGYASSPTGGQAAGEFMLNMVSPIGYSPNDSHIPVYSVRLEDGQVIHVRDPDAPVMIRGTSVLVMTDKGGNRSLMPITGRANPGY